MSSSPPTQSKLKLLLPEFLFLAAVVLAWAIMVVVAGKDVSWDFRNYHWYAPYAFLNGRQGFDVAVAHQATYYNPFLDIPFYLLASHTQAWFALGVLGAVQGANIVPLYAIARSLLTVERRRMIAGILALVCMTGSLTFRLAGTTYYDNVMSVLVLSGLAIVLVQRERLSELSLMAGAVLAAAAGFLVGSAVGLKLPEAPFALGFAAALLVLPGDWRHRATRVLAGGIGGAAGTALFAAFWMNKMAHLTGNPLFPYFNEYFRSPLALHASYRDLRFVPKRLDVQIFFPLLFSIDWRVADDLPFQDIRVGLAYIALLLMPVAGLFGRPQRLLVDARAGYALIAFSAVAYLFWLKMFAIYRYILLLEMLAPILIAIAIARWPVSERLRMAVCAVILLLSIVTMRTYMLGRMPVTDPYIQVTIPPIPHPGKTMMLMTGNEPMGYLAPSIPHEIPIVRIDGWMIQPDDGSLLTAETRKRVEAFRGELFVIFSDAEAARNRDALKSYGLAIEPAKCRNIVTNLGGFYRFCPVIRIQSTSAS